MAMTFGASRMLDHAFTLNYIVTHHLASRYSYQPSLAVILVSTESI